MKALIILKFCILIGIVCISAAVAMVHIGTNYSIHPPLIILIIVPITAITGSILYNKCYADVKRINHKNMSYDAFSNIITETITDLKYHSLNTRVQNDAPNHIEVYFSLMGDIAIQHYIPFNEVLKAYSILEHGNVRSFIDRLYIVRYTADYNNISQ